MRRRVFSKAIGELTASLRLSKEMADTIQRLADEEGETRNAFIVLALDEYLQMKAETGAVPWPKGFDPKNGAKKR
jgi:hypothetical protein